MATTTVTLAGDVTDVIGTDFDSRRTKVFVKHNTDYVVDPDAGVVRLGSGTVSINDDGTFSLPDVIASVSTVENLQATVYVDYANPMTRERKRQSFGPYDLSALTGTVDLTELEQVQHLDASFVSVTMEQMQALLDEMLEISGLTGEDEAVAFLINLMGSATQTAVDGRIATLVPDASTSTKGKVELATTAEAVTGTDADRAVAPAGLSPIMARDNVDFYIDFTTKADGDPPSVLDTGQVVDFTLQNVSNRKPQISSGKLIHGTLPGSGSFANYYQAQCSEDVRAFGCRFTVDSSDGSTTEGFATLAAWAGVYEAAGTTVPKTPGHITISTTTGAWAWWVSDGGGSGSAHLQNVKSGTFTPPASDGTTVWDVGVYIDVETGIGYLYLPGVDSVTGTRWVTLTESEANTFLTGVGLSAITFAQLVSGANVLMVEHFATAAGNTARYPRFSMMWGEALRVARDRARALRQKVIPSSVPAVVQRYAPTTRLDVASTTSLAAVDSTNAKTNACIVGPTGSVLVTALFEIEVTTAEVYLVRMTGSGGGATNTAIEGRNLDTGKKVAYYEWLVTGLTPGTSPRWALYQQSITTAGAVTVRAGGSGSGLRNGIVLKAIPQG